MSDRGDASLSAIGHYSAGMKDATNTEAKTLLSTMQLLQIMVSGSNHIQWTRNVSVCNVFAHIYANKINYIYFCFVGINIQQNITLLTLCLPWICSMLLAGESWWEIRATDLWTCRKLATLMSNSKFISVSFNTWTRITLLFFYQNMSWVCVRPDND